MSLERRKMVIFKDHPEIVVLKTGVFSFH